MAWVHGFWWFSPSMGLVLLLAMAFLGDAQNGEAKWGFICETRNSVNWRLPRGAVGGVGVRGFFLCVGPFGPEIAGGNVGGVLSTLWPLPGALSHPGCAR